MLKRPPLFAVGALLVHALLAIRLQTTAWPEVTTPAYLISRGWLLYRDIGFIHTPGLMETLGLFFQVLGTSAWVVVLFALIWPLAAHAFLLAETRGQRPAIRVCASAFFLVLFYGWGGNAIWPSVMISALSIPIASSLAHGRIRRAGLFIGLAILIKQTAAYLLILVLVRLLLRRDVRGSAKLAAFAGLPYVLVCALFALSGAGWKIVLWTFVSLFHGVYDSIRVAPTAFGAFSLLLGFLPIGLETLLEGRAGDEDSTTWYLLTAMGLALMVYPRFGLLQAVAAVPCLAVGAGRLLRRSGRSITPFAYALVAGIVVSVAPLLIASNRFDGVVVFWNDEPALNALVARLERMPPQTRVYSEIWDNVLPQAHLLPPGRFYAHPWLMPFIASIDSARARLDEAAASPGTVRVGFGGVRRRASAVGPYVISAGGETSLAALLPGDRPR
jgi:hypothetical protein